MRKFSVIFSFLILLLCFSSLSWALPNCPKDVNKSKDNCIGTFKYPYGGVYVGEYKNNVRHGKGTFTYKQSGFKYIGSWKNDKKNGKGTEIWSKSGDKFTGLYKDGKRHGQGVETFKNGKTIKGIWNNGKLLNPKNIKKIKFNNKKIDIASLQKKYPKCTKGSILDECFYDTRNNQQTGKIGYFKNNKLWEGYGFLEGRLVKKYVNGIPNSVDKCTKIVEWYRCPDGQKQKPIDLAHLNKKYKEGKWLIHLANGDKFEGNFKKGTEEGYGIYKWKNGNSYYGNFKKGRRTGQGKFIWRNGDQYVGEYKNGKQNGKGTFTFVSGNKYDGEYKDGKRNGQGTFTWNNGDQYIGEYKDGNQHGKGIFTFGQKTKWAGHKYVGEFKNNKFNGQGTYTFSNGREKKGIWKDGQIVD